MIMSERLEKFKDGQIKCLALSHLSSSKQLLRFLSSGLELLWITFVGLSVCGNSVGNFLPEFILHRLFILFTLFFEIQTWNDTLKDYKEFFSEEILR